MRCTGTTFYCRKLDLLLFDFSSVSITSASQAFVLGCFGAVCDAGGYPPTQTPPRLLPTPIICIDLFLMRGSSPCWQVCPASQAGCRRVEVLINHSSWWRRCGEVVARLPPESCLAAEYFMGTQMCYCLYNCSWLCSSLPLQSRSFIPTPHPLDKTKTGLAKRIAAPSSSQQPPLLFSEPFPPPPPPPRRGVKKGSCQQHMPLSRQKQQTNLCYSRKRLIMSFTQPRPRSTPLLQFH